MAYKIERIKNGRASHTIEINEDGILSPGLKKNESVVLVPQPSDDPRDPLVSSLSIQETDPRC